MISLGALKLLVEYVGRRSHRAFGVHRINKLTLGAWSGILRNHDARRIRGSSGGLRRSHSLLKASTFIYPANLRRDACLTEKELRHHLSNLTENAHRRKQQQGFIA